MKYERPEIRDLNGQSVSGGPPIPLTCISGSGVGEACISGTNNPTNCNTGGENVLPTDPCSVGNSATDCAFGNLALGG